MQITLKELCKAVGAEGLLCLLIQNIDDAVFVVNVKTGHYVFASEKALEITGLTLEEIKTKTTAETTKDGAEDRLKQVAEMRIGESVDLGMVLYKNQKTNIRRLVSLVAVRISEEFAYGIINDITSALWSATFDAHPDAITIHDPYFEILEANKAASELLGLPMEEIVGKKCYQLFHGTIQSPEGCPSCKSLITRKPCYSEGEEPYLKKHLQVISIPHISKDPDKILGQIHIVRDISDKKRSERALKRSLEEKEILIREVQHRVKNNMNMIMAFLGLQGLNSRDEKVVSELEKAADRIRTMQHVYEMLCHSDSMSKIDLTGYLNTLATHLLDSMDTTGSIKLHLDAESVFITPKIAVPCGLIVNELVTNSLKYAFRGIAVSKKIIHITLRQDALDIIKITVSDNGKGFDSEKDLNNDSLGMQIVQNYVNQINGKLEINGYNGASFVITFDPAKIDQ